MKRLFIIFLSLVVVATACACGVEKKQPEGSVHNSSEQITDASKVSKEHPNNKKKIVNEAMDNAGKIVEDTLSDVRKSAKEAAGKIAEKKAEKKKLQAEAETSAKTSVKTSVKASVETPIETPVETPVEIPVETPVEIPVETPVASTPETIQQPVEENVTTEAPIQDIPVVSSHYYNPGNNGIDINSVSIKPFEVYYDGDCLVANCYVINGLNTPVRNVMVNGIQLNNNSGEIATAAFGELQGAVIGPMSYIPWTFTFGPDCIAQYNADMSYLGCLYSTNYVY